MTRVSLILRSVLTYTGRIVFFCPIVDLQKIFVDISKKDEIVFDENEIPDVIELPDLSFEDVSDINNIAIPCIFYDKADLEYKTLKKLTRKRTYAIPMMNKKDTKNISNANRRIRTADILFFHTDWYNRTHRTTE